MFLQARADSVLDSLSLLALGELPQDGLGGQDRALFYLGEAIAGVVGLGGLEGRHAIDRDLSTIVAKREEALVHAEHETVDRRTVDGLRDQGLHLGAVGRRIDLDEQGRGQGPTHHGASKDGALHRVVIVEGESDVADLERPRRRQRCYLVHVRSQHPGGQERERTGSDVVAVEVWALIAGEAPGLPRRVVDHNSFFLHSGERAHPGPE